MAPTITLLALAAMKEQWDEETQTLIEMLTIGILAKLGHTGPIEITPAEMLSFVKKWRLRNRITDRQSGAAYRMQIVPRTPDNTGENND